MFENEICNRLISMTLVLIPSMYICMQELLYKFKPDRMPPQRMMYYPVCYIDVPEVIKLAHSNDGKVRILFIHITNRVLNIILPLWISLY